ncbi:MAG TPA: hypothetical protein VFE62_03555 [Gemmataceae bacterium]|nr:hypothetical protein [Gemmataceae bacterium]
MQMDGQQFLWPVFGRVARTLKFGVDLRLIRLEHLASSLLLDRSKADTIGLRRIRGCLGLEQGFE